MRPQVPVLPEDLRTWPRLTLKGVLLTSILVRAVVKCSAVLVLVLSLGLHWALLQTVAWTGMLVSFSRDGSFVEAVNKTFDGNHPCSLCKAIAKGRAAEKQQEQKQIKTGGKLELGVIWQPTGFNFACDREQISSPESQSPSRNEEPPKPRPRFPSPTV